MWRHGLISSSAFICHLRHARAPLWHVHVPVSHPPTSHHITSPLPRSQYTQESTSTMFHILYNITPYLVVPTSTADAVAKSLQCRLPVRKVRSLIPGQFKPMTYTIYAYRSLPIMALGINRIEQRLVSTV